MNKDRVRFIANSIRKRYNPALSVLVVCPADNTKKMDVKQDKFFVVQKVKCLLAFKELDSTGDFVKLHGHKKQMVLCFVLCSYLPDALVYYQPT